MKTEWDYTALASAYLRRPDYADSAVDRMLDVAGRPGRVCDVGAGVAHLTLMLAARGCTVNAVEPNDAMRGLGTERTAGLPNVQWFEGTGENTRQPPQSFDLVTFGSSFNVTDRLSALRETKRILQPGGWFACMWNHRKLDDPTQSRIEALIAESVPGYDYGTRREDQTSIIDASGLFGPVTQISGTTTHRQSIHDCVEAWRSHATLQRQAGPAFETVVSRIAAYLGELQRPAIDIPYTTKVWMARLR